MKQEKSINFKPTALSAKLASKLTPFIQLYRTRVLSSSYFRDPVMDSNPGQKMRVDISVSLVVKTDVEENNTTCIIDFVAAGRPFEGQAVPFKVEVKFEVGYRLKPSEMSSDDTELGLAHFCHISSISHAWPFLRQHVYDAMGRMAMKPLSLPLIQPSLVRPSGRAVKDQPSGGGEADKGAGPERP